MVEAGVVNQLPVLVLLGWDNPDLEDLLQEKEGLESEAAEVMAVTTRAQKKKQEEELVRLGEQDKQSGAIPKPIQSDAVVPEEVMPGAGFAEDLFSGGHPRVKKTRIEKREQKCCFLHERQERHPLQMTAGELSKLQQENSSLEAIRKAANGEASTAGRGVFEQNGLLYCKWTPSGQENGELTIDQLILPVVCRKAVIQLAHAIPLAGHMGRMKTAQRILQRF